MPKASLRDKGNALKQGQAHGNKQVNEIYCPHSSTTRMGFKNGSALKEKFDGKLKSKQWLFLEGKARNQNS